MSFVALLFIAFSSAFSIIWLLNYLPLHSTILKVNYSPRLIICKFLAPFDAVLTFFLVGGSWVGIGVAITGIGTIVYSVLSGIGISIGIVITKKYFIPKWQSDYNEKVSGLKEKRDENSSKCKKNIFGRKETLCGDPN